ncbi:MULTISPECIES: hypothetical protein [Geobacillus]|uniref:hypothetical protein n=1 Tax=Geobacillus TaxID=129337 RepID=UPI00049ECE98|nr:MULTISPECIES: hypothetical protein [Geobacillus]MED0655054.1 hypothetical protein [Anoxybacillus geothermalis]MED4299388.1 hypothetical protein [Geobacillus stearothermophilus]STO13310.1 murein lipoprotein [[Flavobacterium] thermophilum]KDE47194.1 hypothetical protein DI44_13715 [Geobacillus sp. CAMR5420]MBW7641639.1 hypothetical protein [Geobacillus thermoleovorans]
MDGELRALLNAVLERLDVQGAYIEQMRMDIVKLQGSVKQLEDKVDRLQSDVDAMKKDMDAMKKDMDAMKKDMLGVKKDVAALKEGQVRQEKIMERLAIRSIEQEAEIDELRKEISA